jgi:hypothetical protein
LQVISAPKYAAYVPEMLALSGAATAKLYKIDSILKNIPEFFIFQISLVTIHILLNNNGILKNSLGLAVPCHFLVVVFSITYRCRVQISDVQ